MNTLTDDFILTLEYYHDNPDYYKMFTDGSDYFDIINNKKIKLDNLDKYKDIIDANNDDGDGEEYDNTSTHPENILKKLIFLNIKYQEITFKKKTFAHNIDIKNDKPYLLIFDNMQLYDTNIKLIKQIIFKNNYNIFVPSIYIFENVFKNKSFKKSIDSIKKIDEQIEISNPFDEADEIIDSKKVQARNIGIYKYKNKYSILNFNNISGTDKTHNLAKIKKEIVHVKQYIDYYKKDVEYYNLFLKDAEDEIDEILIEYEIDEVNEGLIEYKIIENFNYKLFLKMSNTIKLILGTKETRDSYYIKEIKDYIESNKNYYPVYITKDEISNIRCTINKISSINMYPSIPRYFCYIDGDKLIIKLFSIFFDFAKTGSFYQNKFSENFNIISKNSKPLITKIMTGGYINMSDHTLDKTLDFIKYIKKIDINNDIDKFENIDKVSEYLIECCSKINYFSKYLIDDKDYMNKFINNDPKYISVLDELKVVIQNLLFIESKYTYEELYSLNNIETIKSCFTGQMQILNMNILKYIYYSDKIPNLTNCILTSIYISSIFTYYDFGNEAKRNFIKNLLLSKFFEQHSILIFQVILNIYSVYIDYKNGIDDTIKLNQDGTYDEELPDYNLRFDSDDENI